MVELPASFRTLLIQSLDEYFQDLDDTSDLSAICEAIVESIDGIAEHIESAPDDASVQLQHSTDYEASLVEVLEEGIKEEIHFEFTGEEVLATIERLCEVEWLGSGNEDDELTADFFGELNHEGDDF